MNTAGDQAYEREADQAASRPPSRAHGGPRARHPQGRPRAAGEEPENLPKTDKVDERARLDEALKLNRPLAVADYLKEELRQFWKQKSKREAGKFLDHWCRRAAATDTAVLHTMSKTLQAHRYGLLNWYDEPISTGPLEGINNKIGALQRRAYGYRNYEHLKLRLLTLHRAKYTLAG